MATKKESTRAPEAPVGADGVVSLAAQLTRHASTVRFACWIIGDTPLITHSWSEKARREMLQKQIKAPKAGREARDPETDFRSSLYDMGDDVYGFPATGLKNAILSACHKDKGIARTAVMGALWIDAEMSRTRPALEGAVCDMPLLRIYGSEPAMREDMVRVGAGLQKTASLAYRGQFTVWAMRVTGRYNKDVMSHEQLLFALQDAGTSIGLGEWRNEKRGMFGAFHIASLEEEQQWEAFARGDGPLPLPAHYDFPVAAE